MLIALNVALVGATLLVLSSIGGTMAVAIHSSFPYINAKRVPPA